MSEYIKTFLIYWAISFCMIIVATSFYLMINHSLAAIKDLFYGVPSLAVYLLKYFFYLSAFIAFQISSKIHESRKGTE